MIPEATYESRLEAVRVKFREQWDMNDIDPFYAKLNQLFEGKPRRYVLADLTEGGSYKYSKEQRARISQGASSLKIEKIALYGASSVLRMMAKVVIGILRKDIQFDARFFETEIEAVTWLTKEGK